MDTLAYSYLAKALKSFKPKTNPYRLDNNPLAEIKRILSTPPNAPSKETLTFKMNIIQKQSIIGK
jgi:hypothetical protein